MNVKLLVIMKEPVSVVCRCLWMWSVKNKSIKFTISGMDDEIRKNYKKTHPIGTIVTFTYNGLTSSGKPRHPNYLRIRT